MTLCEGFDFPRINAIYFDNYRSDYITSIQTIFRAIRSQKEKRSTFVFFASSGHKKKQEKLDDVKEYLN